MGFNLTLRLRVHQVHRLSQPGASNDWCLNCLTGESDNPTIDRSLNVKILINWKEILSAARC